MGNRIEEVVVPDIGGAEDIDVIDILVKPGDRIEAETPLITLEGDKATMDVPASMGGIVKTLCVKVGSKVSEGSAILTLEVVGDVKEEASAPEPKSESETKSEPKSKSKAASSTAAITEVK